MTEEDDIITIQAKQIERLLDQIDSLRQELKLHKNRIVDLRCECERYNNWCESYQEMIKESDKALTDIYNLAKPHRTESSVFMQIFLKAQEAMDVED